MSTEAEGERRKTCREAEVLVKVRQIGRESPGVSADMLNDHSDGEKQIEFAKIAFLLQFTSTPGSTVKAAVPCNIWKLICIQEKPELLIISLPVGLHG